MSLFMGCISWQIHGFFLGSVRWKKKLILFIDYKFWQFAGPNASYTFTSHFFLSPTLNFLSGRKPEISAGSKI